MIILWYLNIFKTTQSDTARALCWRTGWSWEGPGIFCKTSDLHLLRWWTLIWINLDGWIQDCFLLKLRIFFLLIHRVWLYLVVGAECHTLVEGKTAVGFRKWPQHVLQYCSHSASFIILSSLGCILRDSFQIVVMFVPNSTGCWCTLVSRLGGQVLTWGLAFNRSRFM